MSLFSDTLKKLIDQKNISVYRLASLSGLNRSTIQYASTGDRMPGSQFVASISKALMLSPGEENMLFESYQITKLGQDRYEQHMFIKKMIECFSTSASGADSPFLIMGSQAAIAFKRDVTVFHGANQVADIIAFLIEHVFYGETDSRFYTTVPPEFGAVYCAIYRAHTRSERQIDIKHLFSLDSVQNVMGNSTYNLRVLSHIFQLMICPKPGYQPFYCYGADVKNALLLSMPFYIVTDTCLLTLSADCSSAILYQAPEVVRIYRDHFEYALTYSSSFSTTCGTARDILACCFNAFSVQKNQLQLFTQPCFGLFLTEELIQSKCNKDLPDREALIQFAQTHFASMKKNAEETKNPETAYFTLAGINFFTETGTLSACLPQYVYPLTPPERLGVLERLRNAVADDTYLLRAIDPVKFTMPDFMDFAVTADGSLEVLIHERNGAEMQSIHISEQSIAASFADFIKNIDTHNFAFDKNGTISVIDKSLKLCRTLCKQD